MTPQGGDVPSTYCAPGPNGALAGAADLHVGATPGPLLHGPAGMAPQGVLGLGPTASHRASVSATTRVRSKRGVPEAGVPPTLTLCLLLSWPQQMSQFPVGGQPSSGLQDPPQLYSPASQRKFPCPPGTQQYPPVGLYGPPGGARPPYPQPRTAVHSSQELHPKHYPKPIYSYR
ncbi:hypothetical protein HPG69_019220 [Diceros bicornis minor]|uniref:Uncharacterized protein n=1 Tax=Diceros bicornis minor TaxID=77932 RepID=A0A7J7FMB8_DICBM|nr:hypothetical protein HPG69_019220 [Diceros bicornis minor]